jgi:hypothetical protein
MARENIQDKRFSFLHSHVAREPHIYEILNEIMSYQNNVLKTEIGNFATIDDLITSRNIKIPFNFMRNKTILNLVDVVLKNYPEQMRTLTSFFFNVDPVTKKLSVTENKEYTLLLSNEDFNRFQAVRNRQSTENFLALVSQFRLFNLTKLMKKSKELTLFSQIIKSEIDNTVFTFKNYTMDKQNNETVMDFCFYKDNYPAVKKTINIEKIKAILTNHSAQVNRRLKKFGILNMEFSDYKDNKLDYLLNILLSDLASSLSNTDLTEVKNFNSLRSCLLKVETLIDPLITASNDIVAFIKENHISSIRTVVSIFPELTEDQIQKWAVKYAATYKFLLFKNEDGITYLIDGDYLLPRFTELHDTIIYQQGDLSSLNHSEKEKMFDEFTILCNAGKNLLQSEEMVKSVLGMEENIKKLEKLIEEYEGYQKSISIDSMIVREEKTLRKKRSILAAISDFLRGLFDLRRERASLKSAKEGFESAHRFSSKPSISKEVKSIIYRIKNSPGKIIALSNYIDLFPVNEESIEAIIDNIRQINLKVVIPIYNARKVLYPNRSQQYLIPDIEYIMVDPEVLQSPESIREYTDSVAGEKVKDEKLPSVAILNIEKYLMSLYNQKKIQMRGKGKLIK